MKPSPFDHSKNQQWPVQPNRRLTERMPTGFSVMYSGMSTGHMLMGDGTVANISARGIGICGDRLVTNGMELSLFIDVPTAEEPVCIAQCRVSWVTGQRFGVEILAPAAEAQSQLRMHMWSHRLRSFTKR